MHIANAHGCVTESMPENAPPIHSRSSRIPRNDHS